MNTYKLWPKITNIIFATTCLIGMFLPWMAASSFGRTDARNVFDPFFDPTRWILLASIVVICITAVVAIITKKDGLSKLSGILGIIASIISLGTVLLVCLGSSIIGSAASSFGVQSGLGVGFYVSLVSIIAVFVFSIVSLKAKN